VLEQHGVREMFQGAHGSVPAAVTDARERIRARGITSAVALNPPEPGEPARLLLRAHRGFSARAGQVNGIVLACAESNADKLRKADAQERHLLVWVDASGPELAMFTQPPPSHAPELPEGIDVVWAATRGKRPGELCERLWRLRPPGGWENLSSAPA
jgi:hypothetical protein